MADSLKLQIRTRNEAGEPAGYDSSIVRVPPGWYATVGDGTRAMVVQLAGRMLRQLSEQQAADLGETLHHADWTITSDPAEVRTLGLMHDCPACRAGVDQALAYLRENPAGEVAVGQLWWAAQ
jgi:hypothetical protein